MMVHVQCKGSGILVPTLAMLLAVGALILYIGNRPVVALVIFTAGFAISVALAIYSRRQDPWFPKTFKRLSPVWDWITDSEHGFMWLPAFIWAILLSIISLGGIVCSVLAVFWGVRFGPV